MTNGPEFDEIEWNKLKVGVPMTEPEPQTMVTCRVNQEGDNAIDIEVTISVPKGTWAISALMGRAERAAYEALQPETYDVDGRGQDMP